MAETCTTVKLTKHAVNIAKPLTLPDGSIRQRLYLDSELKGFGLVVGATAKSFVAIRSVKGRRIRITLGRFGEYSVDEARKDAQEALLKMARGRDPVAEKRLTRARGITLKQALQLTEQTMKTRKRSDRTVAYYRYSIETYLKDWQERPLAEITRADVRSRHMKIATDVAAGRFAKGRPRRNGQGKATANAAMVALRTVWNRALREHPELPVTPTINVDWFRSDKPSTQPLSELHRWHSEVIKIGNSIRRDCLLFMLHTGLRRTNATEVRWKDVDLKNRLLHVPKPKGGRPFDLPLTRYLVVLLRNRQKENAEVFPDSPWIFPAISETGHISEPREFFNGLHWTPHDLRRWFITTAESLDLSPYVIKLLVNHRLPSGDVTAGYIQHEVKRLRPAMALIGKKLQALSRPPKKRGKVA